MRVFSISDLHLAHSVPGKSMDQFGSYWVDHPKRISAAWKELIMQDDLVLIAGDTSWAISLDQAISDLRYIDELPGTKVLCRGNHDYWWTSTPKVRKVLPKGCYAVQGDALRIGDLIISGTRLWGDDRLRFGSLATRDRQTADVERDSSGQAFDDEKILSRERGRLDRSLADANSLATEDPCVRIAMVHYPPVEPSMSPNEWTQRFEAAGSDHVVFGHLHGFQPNGNAFGLLNGVHYHLTSCDFLNFVPKLICEL